MLKKYFIYIIAIFNGVERVEYSMRFSPCDDGAACQFSTDWFLLLNCQTFLNFEQQRTQAEHSSIEKGILLAKNSSKYRFCSKRMIILRKLNINRLNLSVSAINLS